MHALPAAGPAFGYAREPADTSQGLLGVVLLLFLISCIFDPADLVLGLKVWLFLAAWAITLFTCVWMRQQPVLPAGLLVYTLLFILIPLISIVRFWLANTSSAFEGFALLKGFILITLAPMLVLRRVDLLPRLCVVLTILAVAVITLSVWFQFDETWRAVVAIYGKSSGILFAGGRDYGGDLILQEVYFVTSPMLVTAIAYYFGRAHVAATPLRRFGFFTLVAVNAVGMMLAGTRNNMVMALLLPLVLTVYYSRSRGVGIVIGVACAAAIAFVFSADLQVFFDPTERSNSFKLALLSDYARILSDPATVLIGQGLGAYEHWGSRGYYFTTELTYLEVIRNFGILGGAVIFALLLFPLVHPFLTNRSREEKALAIGFGAFLAMCMSNPNLFSSMGTLILSVMLARIFTGRGRQRTPGEARP